MRDKVGRLERQENMQDKVGRLERQANRLDGETDYIIRSLGKAERKMDLLSEYLGIEWVTKENGELTFIQKEALVDYTPESDNMSIVDCNDLDSVDHKKLSMELSDAVHEILMKHNIHDTEVEINLKDRD